KAIPQGIQEENVVTDADGHYVLPLVNAGPYTLTVENADGHSAQVHGTIRAGETADVPIRLLGVAELTVQVLGSDTRTAIRNAKVEVAQLDYPKQTRTAITLDDGTVVFAGGDSFTEGDIVVVATNQADGFAGRASAKIEFDRQKLTVKVYL